jgi:hypothetical protein
MKRFGSTSLTLAFAAAAVVLNGCGGHWPQAQSLPAGGDVAAHRLSWMAPAATSKNLLYVSEHENVLVYDYGTDNQVGELDYFTSAAGTCTDAEGDVFVTNYSAADVLAFAHGKSAPIKTLIDPSPYPTDCAVDPSTGNLAVVNQYGESEYTPGNVAIYSGAKGKPKTYKMAGFSMYLSGAYDARGDLLVSDVESSGVKFAMLPHGGSKFEAITLPHSGQWTGPGFVRWDGTYFDVEFTIGETSIFVWYTIKGSKGTQEGYTSTEESGEVGGPFWLGRIGGPKSVKRANQLVVGTYDGVTGWDYPRGGDYIFQLYDDQRAGGVSASLVR